MKSRIALKILRNCGYINGVKYTKNQVKKAVYVSIRDFNRVDKVNIICDYISGGCNDTFRWRGSECEGWEMPFLDFGTAHRIGQYLV